MYPTQGLLMSHNKKNGGMHFCECHIYSNHLFIGCHTKSMLISICRSVNHAFVDKNRTAYGERNSLKENESAAQIDVARQKFLDLYPDHFKSTKSCIQNGLCYLFTLGITWLFRIFFKACMILFSFR